MRVVAIFMVHCTTDSLSSRSTDLSLYRRTPPLITRTPATTTRTSFPSRLSVIDQASFHKIRCSIDQPPIKNTMSRGGWRMVLVLAVLAVISFLSVGSADAQGTPCKQAGGPDCDTHATCYTSDRGSFCACNGLYTGNGITCKYSTWRVVVYILGSVMAFSLMFYLCMSCLGYRRNQAQLSSYPMEPLGGHRPYGCPPPAAASTQSSAHPAMYAFPQANGFPVQTGYPVTTGFPPQVLNPPTSKVPGPSGTT